MPKIYTIGHSTISVEDFISLLNEKNINCIADVRSNPYSEFACQFNRESLMYELKRCNLKYVYLGAEFGARRTEEGLYTDGIVDFEKVAADGSFEHGMERVRDGILKGFSIALMCSEKEPIQCHRCILVGHQFSQQNYHVEHILLDGTTTTQDEIDILLLDKFFPERNQFSFLENMSEEDMIKAAYRKQNLEVGYRKE